MWRGLIGLGLRSILGKGRRHGVSPARNNQAALVPSSNVTHKLPRNPRMNSKIVPVLVSITHSITSFPASSLTAAEMLAWCTSSPIYFLLSIVLCSVPSVSTDAQSLLERAPLHNALTARVGSDSVSDEYNAGTARRLPIRSTNGAHQSPRRKLVAPILDRTETQILNSSFCAD
jgi:hypothetical protein